MKTVFALIFSVTLVFLAGCSPKAGQIEAAAEAVIIGPEYSANKGLYLPDDTRKSLGLEIADVEEKQIAAAFDFSLHVYSRQGDKLFASGRVPRAHADALHPGQSLTAIAPDGSETTANLIEVVAPADKNSGMVELVAELPSAANLEVGSFVKAGFAETAPGFAVCVPRSAVVQGLEGPFVYATSGNRFMRTPVKIGATSADRVVIMEGLYAGDQVVSRPAMSLWMTELAAVKGGHACCAVPGGGK